MGKKIKPFLTGYCYVCGSPYIQVHHIYYGTANRKISEEYGYIVDLCREHHTGDTGVHFNKALDLQLKRMAQAHYEANYGTTENFIKLFGKSYKE